MMTAKDVEDLHAPVSLAAEYRGRWMLDPDIAFLNHGSFGATPRVVLESQNRWRAIIEGRPIEMLGRRCAELLQPAKEAIARLVRADEADLGFTINATEGINAVLRSMELRAGDELLTTTHVYRAVRQAMKYAADRVGAAVIEVDVPLPIHHDDEIVARIAGAITDRTRMLVIDHVTSPTAVVFPVARLAKLCRERNVAVMVDGAHGPGMVEVDLTSLGVDYYAANLHKWVCAPKGAAFLWVKRELQPQVHPTIISHFLGQGFGAEFGWTGTRDITPWICVNDAIEFLEGLDREIGAATAARRSESRRVVHGASETHPTGSSERLVHLRKHNHEMATWVQRLLCNAWGVTPSTPLDGSMIGSMTTVALPESIRGKFAKWEDVQAAIYQEHRIEVPGVDWGGKWWLRPCCQAYNDAEEYVRLGEAVLQLK
jgi:isopenicillin-N epimerase